MHNESKQLQQDLDVFCVYLYVLFFVVCFFKLCLWLFFCKNFMKKFLEEKNPQKLKQDRPNQSHCLYLSFPWIELPLIDSQNSPVPPTDSLWHWL